MINDSIFNEQALVREIPLPLVVREIHMKDGSTVA